MTCVRSNRVKSPGNSPSLRGTFDVGCAEPMLFPDPLMMRMLCSKPF